MKAFCNEFMLQRIHERLSHIDWASELSFVDGRALPVGAHTTDEDARAGRAPSGFARGYKLLAWSTQDGRVPVWSVMPLNVNEKPVAAEMLRYRATDGVVLADGEYDARHLYDQVEADGGQLLTPLRPGTGKGHIHQSAARNRAAWAWKGMAGYVYRIRGTAERIFAHLSAFGGGLAPLPAWVQTLRRVRRWIGAKLIIYHARWNLRKNAILQAFMRKVLKPIPKACEPRISVRAEPLITRTNALFGFARKGRNQVLG